MTAPIPIAGTETPKVAEEDTAALHKHPSHHGGRSRSHSFAYSGVVHDLPARDSDPLPRRPSLFASLVGSLSRRDMSSTSLASTNEPATPPQVPIDIPGMDHDHDDEAKDSLGLEAPFFSRSFLNNRRSSWGGQAGSPTEDSTTPTRGSLTSYFAQRSDKLGTSPTLGTSPGLETGSFGLFRRLSLGSPTGYKPPTGVKLARTETSPVQPAAEAEPRGRIFERRPSSQRRLSPMSEQMLRAHHPF